MTDLVAKIILSLQPQQFNSGLRDSSRGVERFTRQTRNEMRLLARDVKSMTGNLVSGLRGELVAIGTGWAALNTLRSSAQLDKDLTRMSQTAGVARDSSVALRKELFGLQQQYGTLAEESRKAAETLIASGLSWDQVRGATPAIAPASAVTGAAPSVLAGALGVSSEIYGFDLSQVAVATEVLDKMVVAGQAGNAELEDLASIFARVGGNAKRANLSFDQTLGIIEQLSLIERAPERLATLADSTLRIFTNQSYLENIQKGLNIPFYNQETGARRDSFDVLGDIASVYAKQQTDQQRDALIAFAFGQTDLDTQRGIQALLASGALDDAKEKTEQISAAAGAVGRMLQDGIDNSIDQTSRLRGALRDSADSFVRPINSGINSIIKQLLDTKEQGGWELSGGEIIAGGATALLAAGAAYRYGPRMLRGVLGRGGNLASGVATAKALEHAAGVQPVYVVNMPAGGLPLGVDALPTVGGKPGRGGWLGKSMLPLAIAMSTVSLASTWSSDQTPSQKWVDTAGIAGGLGGGWAGTSLGAAIGTAIAPGIGTAIGGLAGGLLGYLLGEFSAEKLASAVADSAEQKPTMGGSNARRQQRMDGRIKVEVEDKRVTVRQVEATGFDMDVSGYSMAGL